MKILKVILLVTAVISTVVVLCLRVPLHGSEDIDTNSITVQGITNGVAVIEGSIVDDICISFPNDYGVEDLVSVSSDCNIAYIVIEKEKASDDRVITAYIKAENEGIAEMYIRTADGKYESDKYKVNVIPNPENDVSEKPLSDTDTNFDVTVYISQSGTKYHLSKRCAGDNAVPVSLEKSVEDGYQPCKNCAMNK